MDELLKTLERHRNTFAVIGALLVGGFFVALFFSFGNPSDILQALATLLGSVLSGGVAAIVAMMIFTGEEKARARERNTARENALIAIQEWIAMFADRISRETVATTRSFNRNDRALITATIAVLRGLKISELLQTQILQVNPKLLYEMVGTNETIERFIQPLIRSGTIGDTGFSRGVFISPLDANDIRAIAILPDAFARMILKCGEIETGLASTCRTAAQQLFEATDASVQAAFDEHGVVFNYDHLESRPGWYSPT